MNEGELRILESSLFYSGDGVTFWFVPSIAINSVTKNYEGLEVKIRRGK